MLEVNDILDLGLGNRKPNNESTLWTNPNSAQDSTMSDAKNTMTLRAITINAGTKIATPTRAATLVGRKLIALFTNA